VALFILYALYLQFLLRHHPEVTEGVMKTPIDEEASPSSFSFPLSSLESPNPRTSTAENLESQTASTFRNDASCQSDQMDHEVKLSMPAAVILLVCSACVVSVCAEYMVNSIEHVVANARLTEAFLGLIILPLVGNTAELVTAVTVAMKNKLDLAINVTVGSAIQITLFMVPAMVALGWMSGKEVTLFFDMFQTVTLLVTMMMVNFLLMSGKSNCLLGAMLFVCYGIIGIGAFVLPNQNKKTQAHRG
jgi:Ca2+:H+ antiporter